MIIRCFAIVFFTSVILLGCNRQLSAANCASTETRRLINNILTDQAEKLTATKEYDYYNGTLVFGISRIRESLAKFHVTIEEVKAIKKDKHSGKEFCSGVLKVTIPTNMLADADQARKLQHESKIAQYAKQFNIKISNNVFTQDIEYSVKNTIDNTESQIEFKGAGWVNLLDGITTSALLMPILKTQETVSFHDREQSKQVIDRSKQEVEQTKFKITAPEKQEFDNMNEPPDPVQKNKLPIISKINAPKPVQGNVIKDEKQKKEVVTLQELDIRNDIAYLHNEDKPFTGKYIKYHVNAKNGDVAGNKEDKKYIEINYKDGKKNGLLLMWDESGHKIGQINYKDGVRVD